MLPSSTHQRLTGNAVRELTTEARRRLRLGKGGYRREYVRAFAQRVEVADDAVYIKGNKNNPAAGTGGDTRREIGGNRRSRFYTKVAEKQGFEPWVESPPQRFSRPSRSAAPALLRRHIDTGLVK